MAAKDDTSNARSALYDRVEAQTRLDDVINKALYNDVVFICSHFISKIDKQLEDFIEVKNSVKEEISVKKLEKEEKEKKEDAEKEIAEIQKKLKDIVVNDDWEDFEV
jgi:hypothetical protein